MPLSLPLLSADPSAAFPAPDRALRDPNGLLAMGGDLSPTRLLTAYRNGIFPWFSEGQPILWWSPDPRMVLRTERAHLSSRQQRALRRSSWIARADTAFDTVIATCARIPRHGQAGTWITEHMLEAYRELHRIGHAHSIEVYEDASASTSRLVGGLYGVAVGRMFFGESMFSARSGGSKVALAALCRLLSEWGWPLLDAQVDSAHLRRLGAEAMPRAAFLDAIAPLCAEAAPAELWTERFGDLAASELAGGTALF